MPEGSAINIYNAIVNLFNENEIHYKGLTKKPPKVKLEGLLSLVR